MKNAALSLIFAMLCVYNGKYVMAVLAGGLFAMSLTIYIRSVIEAEARNARSVPPQAEKNNQ